MERLQDGKECFSGISHADHLERIKLAVWAFTVAFSDYCCPYLTSIFPSVLHKRGSFYFFSCTSPICIGIARERDGTRASYLRSERVIPEDVWGTFWTE